MVGDASASAFAVCLLVTIPVKTNTGRETLLVICLIRIKYQHLPGDFSIIKPHRNISVQFF